MELSTLDLYSRFINKIPLNIGFVGGIRYFDINKKIIKAFANNAHFALSYIGKQHPGCDLADYCEANGISNVSFSPAFQDDEKIEIYKSVDLINSIYGDNTQEVRTLLPCRLYDAALYRIPILVSKNTYLQKVVEQYGLGLAINIDTEDLLERVVSYIEGFNKEDFLSGCEEFWHTAVQEKSDAVEKIDNFFSQYASKKASLLWRNQ